MKTIVLGQPAYPGILHFIHNVITGEGNQTWQSRKNKTIQISTFMHQQYRITVNKVRYYSSWYAYRLCVRWTHRGGRMNWRQSGSSQLLTDKKKNPAELNIVNILNSDWFIVYVRPFRLVLQQFISTLERNSYLNSNSTTKICDG